MFSKLTNDEVLSLGFEELGVNFEPSKHEVIYSVLRRVCSSLCPSSESKIIKISKEYIKLLLNDQSIEDNQIKDCLRDLINYGDLLQLNEIKITDEQVFPKNHLHLSPQKFIEINDNKIILIGLQKESDFPKETPFETYFQLNGVTKFIDKSKMEDYVNQLNGYNFVEIKEEDWLRLPSEKNIQIYLSKLKEILSTKQNTSKLDDLEICSKKIKFYRDRFKKISNETGLFITRQRNLNTTYTWSFSELKDGKVINHIELPHPIETSSGYDQAFRLLIALDKESNLEHKCFFTEDEIFFYYNFNIPLPKWVDRKFLFNGGIRIENNKKFLITYGLKKEKQIKLDLDRFLDQYLGIEVKT